MSGSESGRLGSRHAHSDREIARCFRKEVSAPIRLGDLSILTHCTLIMTTETPGSCLAWSALVVLYPSVRVCGGDGSEPT